MARIRTIKPEFPQSESLGKVSRDARLLFVNLFTIADDCGRLRGQSRLLASLLYPFDDGLEGRAKTTGTDIDRWLYELEEEDAIRRYEAAGVVYIQITKWLEHQKIDRPSPSRIPEAPAEPLEPSRVTDALPSTLDLGPKSSVPSGTAEPGFGEIFDEQFWPAYPSRGQAQNPKKPARAKFIAACKRGENPQVIITAVKAYAANPTTKVGTEFVKTAEVWLSKECWKDTAPTAGPTLPEGFNADDAMWLAKLEGSVWFDHLYGPKTDPATDRLSRIPAHVWKRWSGAQKPPEPVAVTSTLRIPDVPAEPVIVVGSISRATRPLNPVTDYEPDVGPSPAFLVAAS